MDGSNMSSHSANGRTGNSGGGDGAGTDITRMSNHSIRSSSGSHHRHAAAGFASTSSGGGSGSGRGRDSRLRGSTSGSSLTAAATAVNKDQAAQAAASLQLLLREDPLLEQYGLTATLPSSTRSDGGGGNTTTTLADQVAFPYAAALLMQGGDDDVNSYSSSSKQDGKTTTSSQLVMTQQRATLALQDVERKLALVESLAVKLSRTSPEEVAGHLLRLHGYAIPSEDDEAAEALTTGSTATITDLGTTLTSDDAESTTTPAMVPLSLTTATSTLAGIRDRADRLERQADMLEHVAARVDTALSRCYTRMESTCTRLERVLLLSQTLKMMMRLQFENTKLQNYDLEDVRDLTRAAASVAVLEDLLQKPELQPVRGGSNNSSSGSRILVVETMRPQIRQTAQAVRQAAAKLLQDMYPKPRNVATGQNPALSAVATTSAITTTTLPQLGATLQVYYYLGELPSAVWRAVDHAHSQAEAISRHLWNPTTLANLAEQAKKSASSSSALSSSTGGGTGVGGSSSGGSSTALAKDGRLLHKKLKEGRAEAAQLWARQLTDVASQVRNLHRVLCRKSDPTSRQLFLDVVATAPIPAAYTDALGVAPSKTHFSLFALFWARLTRSLSGILKNIIVHDQGRLLNDVAALYPAVRAAALDMTGRLQETLTASTNPQQYTSRAFAAGGGFDDAVGGSSTGGILGGSFILDDVFLKWSSGSGVAVASNSAITGTAANPKAAGPALARGSPTSSQSPDADNPQAAASADIWTRGSAYATMTTLAVSQSNQGRSSNGGSLASGGTATTGSMPLSGVIHSPEWKALQGDKESKSGLFPLQEAFLNACTERLFEPLQYMFPENVAIDSEGIPIASGMTLLPSKYDIQRFDENIRLELSLADPREGGGDLSAVTMIAECVVAMISQFCLRAKNAIQGPGEKGYVESDWTGSESLHHDRKVIAIVHSTASYLRAAPEKTFVTPYRPATLPQNEEAASMCQHALAPALQEMDHMVKGSVLFPLCRSINRNIGTVLAKIHHQGIYLESSITNSNLDDDSPSFVQKHLAPVFDLIAKNHLARFPPSYSSVIASTVTSYTIYAFLSHVALVRPLVESARLHITQDLADLELALEQFSLSSGRGSLTLHNVDHGRPYAELRAVRQLLFWSGFDNMNKPAQDIARSLLREGFAKELRPSTACHYLFSSYAPPLLSSPHHVRRIRVEDYVATLVQLDGSVEAGEDTAWMTILKCGDTYRERASTTRTTTAAASSVKSDGDPRVADVVLVVGQELLRRRRS